MPRTLNYWRYGTPPNYTYALLPETSAAPSADAVVENRTVEDAAVGKFKVTTLVSASTLPGKEEFFAVDNGDGTYSGKTKSTSYTYDRLGVLSTKVVTCYYADGTTCSTSTYTYYTAKTGELIEKLS
jgi:hypothetical protein